MKNGDSKENQAGSLSSLNSLESVDKTARLIRQLDKENLSKNAKDKLPPVHLWEPKVCGEIDMKITQDGRWFHEGSLIGRPAMVKMFSRILRHDEDNFYYLVTPVEKMRIQVEDAPFVAVELEVQGQGLDQVLSFRTNVGDVAIAGPEHPIRVELDPSTQEPRPYVHIRANLEALIGRSVFYELVGLSEEMEVDGQSVMGVFSGGEFYSFGKFEE